MTRKRPDGATKGMRALSVSEGRGEAEAKKRGRKVPVDSTEDDYDDMIGQACVRDLKAGRTHIVPDEEMDAILRKIRG